jgi:regulator of sigma E protease
MSFLQTVLAFLLALTLLIFVHELGHYLVARWCGVKVLRFSIGFGRPLIRWRVGADRTEWVIAAIPLGGYVRMLDERDHEPGQTIVPQDLPRAFSRRPLWQRWAIVVAGPLANFLLAIGLYAALGWAGAERPVALVDEPAASTPAALAGVRSGDRIVSVNGSTVAGWDGVRLRLLDAVVTRQPAVLGVERLGSVRELRVATDGLAPNAAESDFLRNLGLALAPGKVLIGQLISGEPAERAGLQPGDQVVSVQGQPVKRARELIDIVRANPERVLSFTVLRGRDEISLSVRPLAFRTEGSAQAIGRIGANLSDRVLTERVSLSTLDGLNHGVRQTWDMSVFSLRMLGRMLTGDLSVRNLSGPVTIADLAGQTAKTGWASYISFLALISISLGVLNLLPVPMLDGGHLVYYALEAIRGRPLSERFLELSQKAGLTLVIMMMALALFNDLSRLIGS